MAKIQIRSEPKISDQLMEAETIQAIDESFRSSILQGLTSTVVRYAEESQSDWLLDAMDCDAPITFVHGRQDKTNDIESVLKFARAIGSENRFLEVDDGGSFLHVTHEDLHVACLTSLAANRAAIL